MTNTSTYTCEMCENTYEKGRPDDEAKAEAAEQWPDVDDDDMGVICDNCYRKMFGDEAV